MEKAKQFFKQLFSGNQISSPDLLAKKPSRNLDIRRVSRTPLLIALGIALTIGGCMTYTFALKSSAAQNNSPSKEPQPKGQSVDNVSFLEQKQKEGQITAHETQNPDESLNQPPVDLSQSKPVPALTPPENGLATQPQATPNNPYQDVRFQQWQAREQERQQLEQTRRSTLQNALSADTTVFSNNQPGASNRNQLATLYGGIKQQGNGVGEDGQLDYSQPQASKVNIPAESPDTANYLMHTRVQPVSPFEIKAGTVIPSVMIGGVNSDLPGQIIAQVSQNVYDTASGQYLLIPQGAKLVGSYDHQVTNGQRRVLVIWNRLIYPDASSVNLGGMNGADQGGYAGFTDKTNTHFWPTFRNALMLSAITAGVQLSQPRAQSGDYSYSSQQMVAGALGMQMNQLGAATFARNLNQPPTLTIRPGYVFNVMVNKDVILPPWQSAKTAQRGQG